MGRLSSDDVVIRVIVEDGNAKRKMKEFRGTVGGAAQATDKLDKSVRGVGASFFATGKRATVMGRVIRRIGTNFIAVAAAAIGLQKAIRVFRNMTEETRKFSRQMAQVATITNLGTTAFETLNQRVRSLSRSLPKSADDLGLGLYQALSAGITDVDEAFQVMEASAILASAGLVETGDAVKAVTTVLNAYNLPASEAVRVTDVFFECVPGQTRVLLADGRYVRIDELGDEVDPRVVAFDGRAFMPSTAEWVASGTKDTLRVTTRSGRVIEVTPQHPLLAKRKGVNHRSTTPPKWTPAGDLRPGDRIVVPTALPFFGTKSVSPSMAAYLGFWLAEGHCGTPLVSNTRYDKEIRGWAEGMGCGITKRTNDNAGTPWKVCHTYRFTGDGSGKTGSNPAIQLLKQTGLWGVTCATKHIPGEVFTWDRKSVATFLHWMFNGDGWLTLCVDPRTGERRTLNLGYVSKSERLVRDVAHLLLRFGVVGRIRRRPTGLWMWETGRYEEVNRFLRFIGIDRDAVEAVESYQPSTVLRSHGVVMDDPIVSIDDTGKQEVYDLVVPALRNFVANDIVAHNTVKRGVITVPELAANFGTLATSAALVGVTMQESSAAIATMTRSGINSARATTSLNRFFISLANVAPEVTAAARKMGIEYSALGVALAGGLLPFMQELQEKTGGNIEALAELNPNIRAALTAFVLAGTGAEGFARDMDGMANSAGAAAEALREVQLSVDERFAQIATRFKDELIDIGERILPGILDAMEGILNSLEDPLEGTLRRLRNQGVSADVIRTVETANRLKELNKELKEAREGFEKLSGDDPGIFRRTFEFVFGPGTENRIEDLISDADGPAGEMLPVLLETLQAELKRITDQFGVDIVSAREPGGIVSGVDPLGDPITPEALSRTFDAEVEALTEAIGLVATLISGTKELAELNEELVADDPPRELTAAEKLIAKLIADAPAAGEQIARNMEAAIERADIKVAIFDTSAEEAKLKDLGEHLGILLGLEDGFTGAPDEQLLLGGIVDEEGLIEDMVDRFNELNDALVEFKEASLGVVEAGLTGDLDDQRTAARRATAASIALAKAQSRQAKSTEDSSDAARELRERLREIAAMVDGVTRIADAFGILDDNLRRVLDGAGSLLESFEKLQEIQSISDAVDGGLLSGFGDLTTGVQLQLIGGAASIASGIAGAIGSLLGSASESAAESATRQIDAMRQLENALDRLREEVQTGAAVSAAELDLGNLASDLLSDARRDAANEAFKILGRDNPFDRFKQFLKPDITDEFEGAQLGGFDATLLQKAIANDPELQAAILRLEKILNISGQLSGLTSGDADEIQRAFNLINTLLPELNAGFGSFNDQFAGQMALFQLTVDQFDITDPIKQLENFLDVVVGEFAPGLRAALGDLSTPEARARADEFIAELAKAIASGDFTSPFLFDQDLENEDQLKLLETLDRFFDTIDGPGGPDTQNFSRNVQITEARAGRLLAINTTIATRAEQLVLLALERNQMLGALSGITATAHLGAGDPTGIGNSFVGDTITNFDIDFTVEVETSSSNPEVIGELIGDRIIETIDTELEERQTNRRRTLGET